jgi:hypothetical protein
MTWALMLLWAAVLAVVAGVAGVLLYAAVVVSARVLGGALAAAVSAVISYCERRHQAVEPFAERRIQECNQAWMSALEHQRHRVERERAGQPPVG